MLDTPEARRLYARQGEQITCVKGHPICEIARDIYVGEPRNGDDLINWTQPQPSNTQSVAQIRCATCRGIWLRGSTQAGYQFHFSDGWR